MKIIVRSNVRKYQSKLKQIINSEIKKKIVIMAKKARVNMKVGLEENSLKFNRK